MTMITNSSSVPLFAQAQKNRIVSVAPHGDEILLARDLKDHLAARAAIGVKNFVRLVFDECRYQGGSSRVDLQACKLGTGRRFTTS
jgi:hypothetical protein